MSMLKGKVGFVIPKNKFSGSLVPIFKKSDINKSVSEETNKQQQRKTRWGADLTQDTSVKRGRALAYQTRVDQITEQLASTGHDDQKLNSPRGVFTDELPPKQVRLEKVESLELEKREAIGEILKLNPGYKTPSDYEPVLRVATVPIPVKAHPEFNFLGLVYGSDGETQKKLEKETGTRIQVYGTVTETGKKVEITASDGSELLRVCEEAYVQISADTYEKVDAAADLIELLLNSVLVKPADSKVTSSHSLDGQDTDMATATAVNTSMANQEIVHPGPISFQTSLVSWFSAGQSGSPSGNTPAPISGPSFQRPSFGLRSPAPYIGSSPQSTTLMLPRSHSHAPAPLLQGLLSAYRIGQTGPPRNLTTSTSLFPLVGHPSNILGSPAPQLAERPLLPTSSSPAWPASAPPSDLLTSPSQYPSNQVRPGISFASSQIRSSSTIQFQSYTPQIQQNSPRTLQFPVPRPSTLLVPQPGMPTVGHPFGPSFTPLNHAGPTAPRPPLRGHNDFTFRPQLPPGPPSQRPSQAQSLLPSMSQMSLFRPSLQSDVSQHVQQSFQRPPAGNQMGPSPIQFGGPNPNPHMGLRNHGPVPHFPNAVGSLQPGARPSSQFQQSHNRPGGMFGGNQHSGASSRPQFYDPFRPSSLPASQSQGGNAGRGRKQESDPEYEDLMASVGVK